MPPGTTRSHATATPIADHPVTTTSSEVSLLRWPLEESLRAGLAALGRPRLLLVEDGIAPPDPVDHLEDWVRSPAEPSELEARIRTLQHRTLPFERERPTLDDDGLLHHGDHWVALSDGQVPVARLLLDQIDRVVRFDTIVSTYGAAGGSPHAASVRTSLSRLDARIRTIGLELHTVRRRGVMLRTLRHD